MRLSVRTVVGETLTFTEVPRNASVQELLEMARGAEEENMRAKATSLAMPARQHSCCVQLRPLPLPGSLPSCEA